MTNHVTLISGESGSGKSTSLMNLKNQEGVIYLNCDAGKMLPFKNKFQNVVIDDPYEIFSVFEQVAADTTGKYHTIVIDTVSFMMDRFEAVHIANAANGMKAWGDYGNFFRTLMNTHVAQAKVNVIMLGHLEAELVEATGQYRFTVPVKGALKKAGLESYFTTVINCRKIPLKEIEKSAEEGELLKITPRDSMLGYKHVFQTLTTKATVGDRIRSPLGLFKDKETYIDNDIQIVLNRLDKFYKD